MEIPDRVKLPIAVGLAGIFALFMTFFATSGDVNVRLTHAQAQLRWCNDMATQAVTAEEIAWATHCKELSQKVIDSLMQPSPTTSPTMTTSSAPVGCMSAPSHCGYPDATNTGPDSSLTLVSVTGNVNLTTEGQIYEDKDGQGCITVKAKNITIKNVRVSGSCYYMIILSDGVDGLKIENVELACMGGGTGIANSGYTVARSNIHGCENGLDVGSDVSAADNYIHDIYNGGTAHGDGIQTNGYGHDVMIDHNTISNPGGTSAVITGRDQVVNTTIQNNLLNGGAYTVYCPRNSGTNFQLLNNRFGSDYTFGPISDCDKLYVTASGNVWDKDNSAVAIVN
jgi:hypothetical protein